MFAFKRLKTNTPVEPRRNKNNNTMKKIKSFALFLLITTVGCFAQTGRLTNQIAQKIIQKEFKRDCEQKLTLETFTIRKGHEQLTSYFKEAERKGYLRVNYYTIKDIQGSYQKIKATLTEKAKSELSGKSKSGMYGKTTYYKVATTQVVKILGISTSNDGNSALVRFSYRLKPTALYNLRKYKSGSSNCSNNIIQQDVKFIKFDTGWQMEQPKTEQEKLLELYQKRQ